MGKWVVIGSGIVILILAAYLAPFFVLAPKQLPPPGIVETMDDLDRYFSSMVSEQVPPALDVTILKNGEEIFSRAYGLADGVVGEAATSDHVYHYWSITKSFTAVAIFQLIESGKLSLHAPITNYLPQFVPVNGSNEPVEVTIAHLLNHTSGLPEFLLGQFKWIHEVGEPRFGETRMVNERLGNFRTISNEPGKTSAYRNLNYVLLGAIIEAVTDGTYEDYVREHILIPLNMKDSDFIYRQDMLEKAARGTLAHYNFFTPILRLLGPEGGVDALTVELIENRRWLKLVYTDYAASTSLIGTSKDLSRFGQMLLNYGELDGIRILSTENALNILEGGRLTDQGDMALGYGSTTWFDQRLKFVGHSGGGPGFKQQYMLVPEKGLVIVVLTNSTAFDSLGLSMLIASIF